MPKLLVFQHVAHEILGTLNPLLKDAGFRIRYLNFERHPQSRPRIGGYDGLVVLGGPMSVNDMVRHPHLSVEIDAIAAMLEQRRPVLGICLGAQLLARALGARVGPNPVKEIGWYDLELTDEGRLDPLLGHCGAVERVFQWHGDTFEIPDGARRLARSADCHNQAFCYADNAYGLQFHLEVDEPLIHRWLAVPVNAAELEAFGGHIGAQSIRAETHSRSRRMKSLGRRVFSEFVGLFDLPRRQRLLRSR